MTQGQNGTEWDRMGQKCEEWRPELRDRRHVGGDEAGDQEQRCVPKRTQTPQTQIKHCKHASTSQE